MPASTFAFFDEFGKFLGQGAACFTASGGIDATRGADTLKVYLTNTAVNGATNTVAADHTKITANGGAEKTLTYTWTEQSAGSGIWIARANADQVWTGTGGSFGPFQYAVLYDDSTSGTGQIDILIGYWDY